MSQTHVAPSGPPGDSSVISGTKHTKPWAAVWSMLIGFFMLMIDALIVSVANPTIENKLNTSLTATIWVTSAYMLAMAVPLLVAGRLGDRFGQKNIFMLGMAIFTLASLGCGLSRSIGVLILTRTIQGIGGSLMTPQTQAVIVRLFPPSKRGAPMGLWGAVSGVAMLIAPLLGGFLVDHIGWEAIFLVNVPVGVAGLILAGVFVPKLDTRRPKFDWTGMVLSGIGLFCLVFGIQEGSTHNWGKVWGPIDIWEIIAAGVVVLGIFVVWQLRGTANPLVPMRLFRHRDFALSSAAVMCTGFAVASMPLPLLYYLQLSRGYSAQSSALFMLPMALVAGILSPLVGAKLVHRLGSRIVSPAGLVIWALGILWLINIATPDQKLVPMALFPSAVIGLGNACIWTPLSVTATRNLPQGEAGAGTGIYNTTRQIGSVLGAACISTLMTSRIVDNLSSGIASLPASVRSGLHISQNADPSRWLANATPVEKAWFTLHFTPAMSQSLWLPFAVAVAGAVVAVFLSNDRVGGSKKKAAQPEP